jgi:hypothetical protein
LAYQQGDIGHNYDVIEAAVGVEWQKVVVLFLLEADGVVGFEQHPHLFKGQPFSGGQNKAMVNHRVINSPLDLLSARITRGPRASIL